MNQPAADRLPPLLVVGSGFAGMTAARRALADGRKVLATTRSGDRAHELQQLGIEVYRLDGGLRPNDAARLVPEGAHVLIAFPPDGETDEVLANALDRSGAASVAYVSTTGVYGSNRGRVDELTSVDETDPSMQPRLRAERLYSRLGATILRAAGIYGPGRGLHRRVRDPEFRLTAGSAQVVSRVHVDDLARIALRALRLGERRTAPAPGRVFVVADDEPAPQITVVRWLCGKLGLPAPPFMSVRPTASGATDATTTMAVGHHPRGRYVDNRHTKEVLGLDLLYPTYREGFSACLETEHGL